MTKTLEKDTSYVVEPFVGVGLVRFGMTRAQIAKSLGAPEQVTEHKVVGKIEEIRDGITF